MGRVLFVAPQKSIPDSLSLLSHSISSASSLDEALRQVDLADCIVVGGHVDLAWARTATSTLNQAREHIPILLLLQPSSLSIISAEWGFADFAMIDATPAELELRLRLLLRIFETTGLLKAGPVHIDEAAYAVTLSGEPLDLTYTEFELLRYLAQHEGRVLTRETLLSQVWGYDYYGGTRTVDVHVRRLRAKLGQYDYVIGTVRNVGYRFSTHREAPHDTPA